MQKSYSIPRELKHFWRPDKHSSLDLCLDAISGLKYIFSRRHPRWVDQTGLSAGTLLRETLVQPIWDPAWNWTGGITGTRECHWGGSQRGRWSVIGGLIKARPVCEHVLKSVSKGGWFDLKMFRNNIRATSQNWVVFSKFSTCSIWKLKYCLLRKRDSPRGQR